MINFLNFLLYMFLTYSILSIGFYIFMAYNNFWKSSSNLYSRIFYAFFWPVTIAVIYNAFKIRKEADKKKQSL